MSSAADAGAKALAAGDFEQAITHLTIALDTHARSTTTSSTTSSTSSSHPLPPPLWLLNRATAYSRRQPSPSHDLALRDAEAAVRSASARHRREQVATAQLRRAVALYGLGRLGDARMCLVWCAKMNGKEKGLTLWQAKVARAYEARGGEGAEGNGVVVRELPEEEEVEREEKEDGEGEVKEEVNGGMASSSRSAGQEQGQASRTDSEATINTTSPAPSQSTQQTPREKIRHEWFQSSQSVTITVFAKGVPKDKVEVEIQAGSVEVNFPVAVSNSTYDLTFSPLFAAIDPAKSSYMVGSTKIELTLRKASPGMKWSAIEGTQPIVEENTASSNDTPTSATLPGSKPPSYPTSSRHGPKDWDALANSALKAARPAGKENEDEGLDDDDDGGDPVNGFFKKMYASADPDTRKAMMKSFQESNGTALSTNWAEVGKAPVKTQPPEGVVARKWDE